MHDKQKHMRPTIFIFLLIFVAACTSTKNVLLIPSKLNGTWIPERLEIDGADLPKVSFEKQRLIIADSAYTFIAESTDWGVVKIKDDKMDIYGTDGVNAGKHFTTIWKFENEKLVICYNLAGDKYPETFETKGKPMHFLAVFIREEKK